MDKKKRLTEVRALIKHEKNELHRFSRGLLSSGFAQPDNVEDVELINQIEDSISNLKSYISEFKTLK